MERKELLACIEFFKTLQIVETDVTTAQEKANHHKVVVVTYSYRKQSYNTSKLYYKNILYQKNIRDRKQITSYFGSEVFWLDNEYHQWPKGKGESELEKTVIDKMVVGNDENFRKLLKTIANNNKTGFIQRITSEGKSNMYHHNFDNNNHWHDIILLIQEMINKKGAKVDKKFYSRLVFKWDHYQNNDLRERSSLAKVDKWKKRGFIDTLYQNIKSIQGLITDMDRIKILKQKKQIILQGPPGTGKTRAAKDIAEQIIFGTVSEDKQHQLSKLEDTEQFELIQFHPAYTYEDFVRGIVVETEDGGTPQYKTVNKILGAFAKKANQRNSSRGTDDFKKAWEELVKDVKENTDLKVGTSDVKAGINSEESITFNTEVATYERTYELYKLGKTDLKYEGYNRIVLNYLKDPNEKYKLKDHESRLPFVLVIDEINRANLPAVLGELIYALEYREEKVESMYEIPEEGRALILPNNLYIIGTMNTSDRSVGHIDYAIRRRFAFIDVLPKVLAGDMFDQNLFKIVSSLFIKNYDEYTQNNTVILEKSEHLSEEFRPEDVWLGHSYFIKKDGDFSLRIKYEIVPILKEYVKDGILKQSAESIINSL